MDNENAVVNIPEEQMVQDDAVTGTAVEETLTPPAETVVESSADGSEQTVGDAKDFSKALNKRVASERAKMERAFMEQHSADLELASKIRAMYSGKDDAAIMDEMLSQHAKDFAAQNNVTESLAKRLLAVEARGAAVPTKKEQPAQIVDKRVEMLQEQINDIMAEDGVDMFAVLKSDEVIRNNVASGKWDINRAYAHYMSSESKRTPPVNRSSAGAKAKVDFATMSDEEFDKYDSALKKGQVVNIK